MLNNRPHMYTFEAPLTQPKLKHLFRSDMYFPIVIRSLSALAASSRKVLALRVQVAFGLRFTVLFVCGQHVAGTAAAESTSCGCRGQPRGGDDGSRGHIFAMRGR